MVLLTHCHTLSLLTEWSTGHIIMENRSVFGMKRKTNIKIQNKPWTWLVLLSKEHLLHCPIPRLQGAPFNRNLSEQRREESVKPLPFVLGKIEENTWGLDTVGLSLFPKKYHWPAASLSSRCLEKDSSFSKASSALLETVLSALPPTHPKWLNLARSI